MQLRGKKVLGVYSTAIKECKKALADALARRVEVCREYDRHRDAANSLISEYTRLGGKIVKWRRRLRYLEKRAVEETAVASCPPVSRPKRKFLGE